MEASGAIAKDGGGGGGGISVGIRGGDRVRRLHIIYFLSRMGRIEQPHLIRVHHVHRNGVHLRDVKRWLADLRGKDMPEAFAWSYKRKYKDGYVWQDLMDDDLITPICDNEYVLKGSEIFPTCPFAASSLVGTKASDRKAQADSNSQELEEASPWESYAGPRIGSTPRKSSSEICQESPVFSSDGSTITQAKINHEEGDLDSHHKRNSHGDKLGNSSSPSSFYNILLGDKRNKTCNDNDNSSNGDDNSKEKEASNTTSSSSFSSSSSQSPFSVNKSRSSGTSKMLRNLLNCGAVDTNDNVLVSINKSGPIRPKNGNNDDNLEKKAEICARDAQRRGSAWGSWHQQQHKQNARRSFEGFRGSKKQQQQQGSDHGNPTKTVAAAYKPVGAPSCSQCGKSFKPEKLHTHMKSCKGMKASTKAAAAANSHKKMQFDQLANPLYENQLVAIS